MPSRYQPRANPQYRWRPIALGQSLYPKLTGPQFWGTTKSIPGTFRRSTRRDQSSVERRSGIVANASTLNIVPQHGTKAATPESPKREYIRILPDLAARTLAKNVMQSRFAFTLICWHWPLLREIYTRRSLPSLRWLERSEPQQENETWETPLPSCSATLRGLMTSTGSEPISWASQNPTCARATGTLIRASKG